MESGICWKRAERLGSIGQRRHDRDLLESRMPDRRARARGHETLELPQGMIERLGADLTAKIERGFSETILNQMHDFIPKSDVRPGCSIRPGKFVRHGLTNLESEWFVA
jgi:hypothetical protein